MWNLRACMQQQLDPEGKRRTAALTWLQLLNAEGVRNSNDYAALGVFIRDGIIVVQVGTVSSALPFARGAR